MINVDSLILLNENIIDRLFDTFVEDFQLKIEYGNDWKKFLNHIRLVLKKYNIGLNVEVSSKQNVVTGKYLAASNYIIIYVPVRKFSLQEVMNVIFHEFAHHITEEQAPGVFNPTTVSLKDYEFPVGTYENSYKLFGLFLEKNILVF